LSTKQIGIKDVAAAAGVSITTVSHALNGKGRLPEETRIRVRDVARRLGYRPNANARSLAGGKSGVLALTVSQAEGLPVQLGDFDYFAQLTNAATSAAIEHGYALMVSPATHAETTLHRVQVDGAIVVDPVAADLSVAHLRTNGIPFVTTGREPGAPEDEFWIDNDHVAGIRSALDHLAESGGRQIALVTPPPVQSYLVDALRGYEQWCAEHDTEPVVSTVSESLTEGGGYAAAWDLLDNRPTPDAIYATLDRLALGILLAADARAVRVPDALLVAGCTDSHAGQTARPSLTALSLNPEAIGEAAVEMLIAIVEGRPPGRRHEFVPTSVIPRESSLRRVGGQQRRKLIHRS
jgi:DNA-binding LacI/PurR family transcriptional regulator